MCGASLLLNYQLYHETFVNQVDLAQRSRD